MKSLRLVILNALLLIPSLASGQVVVYRGAPVSDVYSIDLNVTDSLSREPLEHASAYLIEKGDSVFTSFTLTDKYGHALMYSIPFGEYELGVEYVGYKPYKKRFWLRENSSLEIKLVEDPEMLNAATVSAVGDPVEFLKDTIVYNASSFKTLDNAMLSDLLKKMPGIEVEKGGGIKVNGQSVTSLTVNGKTFFFGDASIALNNLPAKFVDKVKVIDKDSDKTKFTGEKEPEKEKVMDVQLKKEYSDGWFGNLKAGIGAELASTPKGKNLRDKRGVLYDGNAMVSGYNEKDQITFVASATNTDGAGSDPGINTAYKAGANYTTQRIKGYDTGVSLRYGDNNHINRSASSRTAWQATSDDLVTDTDSRQTDRQRKLSGTFNLDNRKYNNENFFLDVSAGGELARRNASSVTESVTKASEGEVNNTGGNSVNSEDSAGGSLLANVGYRTEKGFSIMSMTMLNGSAGKGSGTESSVFNSGSGGWSKNLRSDLKNSNFRLSEDFSMAFPVSQAFMIASETNFSMDLNSSDKQSFDNITGIKDETYSSLTDVKSMIASETLSGQLLFGDHYLMAGAKVESTLNEVRSIAKNYEDITGKGDWNWNVSPYLSYYYEGESHSAFVGITQNSVRPSGNMLAPVLNISNPALLRIGNDALRHSSEYNLVAFDRFNLRDKGVSMNAQVEANLINREIVYASWFDTKGVRISVPVNADKPSWNTDLRVWLWAPLNKSRTLQFSLYGHIHGSGAGSWQSVSRTSSVDIDNFDYAAFMADFQGVNGSRLRSGESGFSPSRRNSLVASAAATVKLNLEVFNLVFDISAKNSRTWYSLDNRANTNVRDYNTGLTLLYTTPWNMGLETSGFYRFYRGYQSGFGDPEFKWDFAVTQNLGPFTLSLEFKDILDQTHSLARIVSEEYCEDTYRSILGRHFLFKVAWNFGKGDSAHRVQASRSAR